MKEEGMQLSFFVSWESGGIPYSYVLQFIKMPLFERKSV